MSSVVMLSPNQSQILTRQSEASFLDQSLNLDDQGNNKLQQAFKNKMTKSMAANYKRKLLRMQAANQKNFEYKPKDEKLNQLASTPQVWEGLSTYFINESEKLLQQELNKSMVQEDKISTASKQTNNKKKTIETIRSLIFVTKKRYKIDEMLKYCQQYLSYKASKRNLIKQRTIQLLYNFYEGKLANCFEEFIKIREEYIILNDEKFREKSSYRMFSLLVKIAITNMGILRYSETTCFLERYFECLIMKLKLKFKEQSKRKIADKIIKAHLSYATFLIIYALNVKKCESTLQTLATHYSFETIRNNSSTTLLSKIQVYLNMIYYQKYSNKKFLKEAKRLIKEDLPPNSEYLCCIFQVFDETSQITWAKEIINLLYKKYGTLTLNKIAFSQKVLYMKLQNSLFSHAETLQLSHEDQGKCQDSQYVIQTLYQISPSKQPYVYWSIGKIMFQVNPFQQSQHIQRESSVTHSSFLNCNVVDKKNALYLLLLKDNLQIGEVLEREENGDILQKFIKGLFQYLYSDEDPNDIENKDKISSEVLSLVENNQILKHLKKQAEQLLKNDGIHQIQSSDEVRKQLLESAEYNQCHPFLLDCYQQQINSLRSILSDVIETNPLNSERNSKVNLQTEEDAHQQPTIVVDDISQFQMRYSEGQSYKINELKSLLSKIMKIYIDYIGEDVVQVLNCSYEIALCYEKIGEFLSVIETCQKQLKIIEKYSLLFKIEKESVIKKVSSFYEKIILSKLSLSLEIGQDLTEFEEFISQKSVRKGEDYFFVSYQKFLKAYSSNEIKKIQETVEFHKKIMSDYKEKSFLFKDQSIEIFTNVLQIFDGQDNLEESLKYSVDLLSVDPDNEYGKSVKERIENIIEGIRRKEETRKMIIYGSVAGVVLVGGYLVFRRMRKQQ